MEANQYRLLQLSRLDVAAITRQLDPNAFTVETPLKDPAVHNELATVAIIGGIGVISAAAAYFFGKRKTEEVDLWVEVKKADGTEVRIKVTTRKNDVEPVDTQIMKQLKEALQG
jgi:hypothetical protein